MPSEPYPFHLKYKKLMEQNPEHPWNEVPVQELEMALILPDPGNKRRHGPTGDDGLQELAESITRNGLIQPIVLRPISGHTSAEWMIVAGDRRFQASQLAGFTTIRAFVLDIDAEHARELQIIENLHRKDIHPLQEAEAFRELMERMGLQALCRNIGKNQFYVARRLRLNQLLEPWKHYFEEYLISEKQADLIARMAPGLQEKLLAETKMKISRAMPGEFIDLPQIRGMLKDAEHDLELAPFDTTDEHLIAEVGACTTCQFNSKVAELFQMDAGSICRNGPCFEAKSAEGFHLLCLNAHEEGSHLLSMVFTASGKNAERKKALQGWGYPVLNRDDFRIIQKPTHPGTLEEFSAQYERSWPDKPRYFDDDWNDRMLGELHEWTEAEIREAEAGIIQEYERAVARYTDDQALWEQEKELVQLPGVIVLSDIPEEVGRKVMVFVKNLAALNGTQAELDMSTPEGKIIKMAQRAERSQQRDDEQRWKDIRALVRGEGSGADVKLPLYRPSFKEAPLSTTELVAAVHSLYHRCSNAQINEEIRKWLKMKNNALIEFEFEKQMMAKLQETPEEKLQELLAFLTRNFILQEAMPASHLGPNDPIMITSMAFIREKAPKEVAEIELRYEADQHRREKRLKKRIGALQAAGDADDQDDDQDE